MSNQLLNIVNSIVLDLMSFWPYLVLTIPLSVVVQMTGAAKYINRALGSRPTVAILLSTLVGAFSPFCSCSVIPVVASLLISGVPLGPVMAFWIASPSMDPEIFFLSAAALGWPLAVWRLASTLVLSLSAGFITQYLRQNGWLGKEIIKSFAGGKGAVACSCSCNSVPVPVSFSTRLFKETWAAVILVMKFMILSFILKALIRLYVPIEWLTGLLGSQNDFSILTAALIGVPMYTSNLAALPLIGTLLGKGMAPAAALAFLIAGPTTTIPAMAAVWGIVNRRVFVLYLSFSFLGAIVFGYLYQIINS